MKRPPTTPTLLPSCSGNEISWRLDHNSLLGFSSLKKNFFYLSPTDVATPSQKTEPWKGVLCFCDFSRSKRRDPFPRTDVSSLRFMILQNVPLWWRSGWPPDLPWDPKPRPRSQGTEGPDWPHPSTKSKGRPETSRVEGVTIKLNLLYR